MNSLYVEETSKNKHLKLLNCSLQSVVNNIIKSVLNTKKTVRVLNIGGGYEKSIERFLSTHSFVDYYCLDIDIERTSGGENFIEGDITAPDLVINKQFDFIYTSDTFEHILNPWDATENVKQLMDEAGYILCQAPFSWRYHACPVDTYRYTHTGMRYIFERLGGIRHIFSGYKRFGLQNGWYKSKTDVTLDGSEFKENIKTVYIGQRDDSCGFDIASLDFDEEPH